MKLAIVCASGIGDALIFQTASFALRAQGWEATIFSDHLKSFGSWTFSDSAPQPTPENMATIFSPFDAIFLQHDNSPKAFQIKTLGIPVFTFYGSHLPSKHGNFQKKWDYLCDRSKTMVENLSHACLQFFQTKIDGYTQSDSKVGLWAGLKAAENRFLNRGLYSSIPAPCSRIDFRRFEPAQRPTFESLWVYGFNAPPTLIHRRFKQRVAIHPTASSIEKIWPRHKFLNVAAFLKEHGYEPVFTVSPEEAPEWNSPVFPTLHDLASFIYESGAFLGNDSGTAHLASLLQIPHLVIAGTGEQMPLWKTGWYPGHHICPPRWLMNMKALRKRWKLFISEKDVIKILNCKILSN
ncbi:MAG TPA: glycosyltransferase family 9 protein [Chlamydiales bacterium]|nr:glycosyltransferase family 9 protein [Chlamydiales bacterium]